MEWFSTTYRPIRTRSDCALVGSHGLLAVCSSPHKNILRYCNRPFRDTNEMDEIIIENLEASVKPQDT